MFFVPAFDPTAGLKNKISEQVCQDQFYKPDDVHAMVVLGQLSLCNQTITFLFVASLLPVCAYE